MSVIYRVSCKDETIKDCYIGSSINFKQRKIEHKSRCNNENTNGYNFKLYKFIRDNGGFDNWKFDILEELETTTSNEMLKKERYYYDLNNATLNSDTPNRSLKEYYNDNKEYKQNYHKLHYEKNKDEFIEKSKNYYHKNKTIILQKRKLNIECNICNCLITKINLKRHQKSKKCNNIRLELLKLYFNIWKK